MATAQTLPKRTGSNGRSPYGIPYISASRLKMFRRCPMQFYLRYIVGMPIKASLAMFKGSMLHKGLELYYKSRWLGRELTLTRAKEHVIRQWSTKAKKEGIKFKSAKDSDKQLDDVLRGVEVYLSEYGDEMPRAVEAELRAPVPGLEWPLDMLGYVDLIRSDGTLIEIKTTSKRPSDTSDEAVIFGNSIQLAAYDFLYRHIQGEPFTAVELRTVVLKKEPEVLSTVVPEVPWICKDIHHRALQDLLGALKEKHFPRNVEGMFCPCTFFKQCREQQKCIA